MRDVTEEMKRKEEEYLHKIAERYAVPEKEAPLSPVPGYLSALLQLICLGVLILMVAALVAVYCMRETDAAEHVEQGLVYAAWGCVTVVFVVNAIGWLAISWQSRAGMHCFAFLVLLLCGFAGFAVNQLIALKFSQTSLQEDLRGSKSDFTVDDLEEVVNGGPTPSLVHRFVLDGPAHFLRWLQRHCASFVKNGSRGAHDGGGNTNQKVDSLEFYAGFWKPPEQECANSVLATYLQIETVTQVILAVLLAVMILQLALHWLLILLEDDPESSSSSLKQRKGRRRKGAKKSKPAELAKQNQRHKQSLASAFRLVLFAVAFFGSIACAVSADLLQLCDFRKPVARWVLAGVFLSGFVSILAGVLISCCHSRGVLVKCMFMVLLASELYALSNCIAVRNQIHGDNKSDRGTDLLRSVYGLVANQTCPVVTEWRAHTCEHSRVNASRNSVTTNGEGFDSVCEEELASLMLETLKVGISLLGWLVAAHSFLLLSLLLPDIRRCGVCVAQCCCCRVTTSSSASSPPVGGLLSDPKQWKQASLQLEDARNLYLSTVRINDPTVLEAEAAAFDSEWMLMTGRSASDIRNAAVVFQNEFEAIVRSLVIRRLTLRCKMDVSLSVSKDGRLVFVKIFASDNLLMTALCDMDYALEFSDAVDPGPQFWQDKVEIKNDLKVLDPRTVKQKLKLLASRDVISRKEAERFPNESLSRVSARIHVLTRASRIANESLKCQNFHLPFAQYVPRTEFQYLYKKYPNQLDLPGNVRRSSVLRTIDCLRIARHLIESEMNVNQMLQGGLLTSFHCLHSASRFDFNSRETLRSSWVLFWRPPYLPGEYDPEKHWFLNQLGRYYPFRQPLRDVRDYFGESIAFYFAWLAFYTHLLLGPALVAAVLLLCQRGEQEVTAMWSFYRSGKIENTRFVISPVAFAHGIGTIVWSFLFAKLWERKSIWYQLEWGTTRLDLNLHDRASFWGEMRRNPITNEVETHFPGQKRLMRQFGSWVVIGCLGAANLFLVITLILIQGYFVKWLNLRLAVVASSCCQAFLIQWNGELISSIAHRLSELENYQNEVAFQESVISKAFVLQFMNTYSGLLLLAFGDVAWFQHTFFRPLYQAYRQNVAEQMNAMVQIETLLLAIFLTRIASHVLAIAHSFSLSLFALQRQNRSKSKGTDHGSASVEDENALEPYRGSYEDYTQIVVQFGLVVMFSSVFPLAPLLAFIECVLEMRLDALDLCMFFQRPSPDVAKGIGPWSACIQIQLKISFVVIFGLMYFAAENHSELTFVQRMSSFLLSTLACWLLSEMLWFLLPSTSRQAQEAQARNDFLVERYLGDDMQSSDGLDKNDGSHTKGWLVGSLDDDSDPDGSGASALPLDSSLEHYKERIELLRRLNVALRKHDDLVPVDDPVSRDKTDTVEQGFESHPLSEDQMDASEEKESTRSGLGDESRSPSPRESLEQVAATEASNREAATSSSDPLIPPPDSATGSEEPVLLGIPIAEDVGESSVVTSTSLAEAAVAASGRRSTKRASFFARLAKREPHSVSTSRKSSASGSSEGFPASSFPSQRTTRLSPSMLATLELEANAPPLPPPSDSTLGGERLPPLEPPIQAQSRVSLTRGTAAAVTQPAPSELNIDVPRQYTTKELSGVDAITEAVQRSRFDFSIEEGTTEISVNVLFSLLSWMMSERGFASLHLQSASISPKSSHQQQQQRSPTLSVASCDHQRQSNHLLKQRGYLGQPLATRGSSYQDTKQYLKPHKETDSISPATRTKMRCRTKANDIEVL